MVHVFQAILTTNKAPPPQQHKQTGLCDEDGLSC